MAGLATYMDPHWMNYIILGLYILNALWYTYLQSWPNVIYWTSAAGIVGSMTWGLK